MEDIPVLSEHLLRIQLGNGFAACPLSTSVQSHSFGVIKRSEAAKQFSVDDRDHS